MVEQLLSSTALLHAEILVVGDFNDNLMGNTTKIRTCFEHNGFNQLIDQLVHYWIVSISKEFLPFKLKCVTHIIRTMTVQLLHLQTPHHNNNFNLSQL